MKTIETTIPDRLDRAVDELIEQYTAVLVENGGSVGRFENWGLKTLAYRINKNRKAHFALMDIDAPAPAIGTLARVRLRRFGETALSVYRRSPEHAEGGR